MNEIPENYFQKPTQKEFARGRVIASASKDGRRIASAMELTNYAWQCRAARGSGGR